MIGFHSGMLALVLLCWPVVIHVSRLNTARTAGPCVVTWCARRTLRPCGRW